MNEEQSEVYFLFYYGLFKFQINDTFGTILITLNSIFIEFILFKKLLNFRLL